MHRDPASILCTPVVSSLAAVVKCYDKSHLVEKGLFGSRFQVAAGHNRESEWQELEGAGHIKSKVRRAMGLCTLALFHAAQRMVLATVKMEPLIN